MSQLDLIARALSRTQGARASGGSATSDELRAFVQRRVAGFSLLLTGLFGLFFAWRLIATVLADDLPVEPIYLPFQGGAVAVFAAMWLLLRGRPRSARFIQVVELVGLAIGASLGLVMALYIPYFVRPDYIMTLALGIVLVGRSAYVPSRAAVTLRIAALIGPPLLATVYFIHMRGHDPAIYTAAAPAELRGETAALARQSTIALGFWWLALSGLAAATSRVIYGLREEVRDARRLGQYTLIEKIGQGGMGEVYRATHAMLRRPTAVKLLPPDRLGEDSVARFEREVQLTARLTHPNTVRVFDYGRTPDRVFYYAMELLEGATLAEVVAAGGPLPAARVIHVLEQCAGALAEAHGIGLIHRDIKPANILLTEQGGMVDVAKVVDFGLVKEIAAAAGAGDERTIEAITRDDSVAGTPHYMAPEAITGEQMDGRADLYALGAVGYYLLTGADVFSGRTVLEVCSHHLQSDPVPPSERLGAPVPADLERLILRCLAKDADDRPASARELRAGLLACGDAGRWSEEEARAWWVAHAGRLSRAAATARTEVDVAGATVLAVDVASRR